MTSGNFVLWGKCEETIQKAVGSAILSAYEGIVSRVICYDDGQPIMYSIRVLGEASQFHQDYIDDVRSTLCNLQNTGSRFRWAELP